jgi:hypothetical protein
MSDLVLLLNFCQVLFINQFIQLQQIEYIQEEQQNL